MIPPHTVFIILISALMLTLIIVTIGVTLTEMEVEEMCENTQHPFVDRYEVGYVVCLNEYGEQKIIRRPT